MNISTQVLSDARVNRSVALDRLPVLTLRLLCRFEQAAPSSAHAGEMWRGAIKEGLRRQSPKFLSALFEPERCRAAGGLGGAAAKTNTLTPGMALRVTQAHIESGSRGQCQQVDLTFFGDAARYALPVMYGLMAQGADGVGGRSLHFGIENVHCRAPTGEWRPWALPAKASDITATLIHPPEVALTAQPDTELQTVALALSSRMRVKVDQMLLRQQPALTLLVDRLVNRANLLGTLWGLGAVVTAEGNASLTAAAELARSVSGTSPRLVRRRVSSGRQEANYAGDGLAGVLAYQMPAHALRVLVPLLALGELTHVGEQTTMGSGHYRLLLPN